MPSRWTHQASPRLGLQCGHVQSSFPRVQGTQSDHPADPRPGPPPFPDCSVAWMLVGRLHHVGPLALWLPTGCSHGRPRWEEGEDKVLSPTTTAILVR